MAESLSLLNIYDIESEQGPISLLCFLDPALAGSRGIEPRSIIGVYTAGEDGEFDPEGFRVDPPFVESLTGYMNAKAAGSPIIASQAKELSGDWLYLVDPRDRTGPDEEPPTSNVLGAFAVDDSGQVVPGSFQYNSNHRLFDRDSGTSALLFDRSFYDWLHGIA